VNCTKFLGYDKDEDRNLVINEKQAKIVRRIYSDYLDGKGPNRIARELEEEGVPNWNGKAKWYESSIRKMLSNEKYKGEALLQKTYTTDFLTKKRVKNNGEVPQYYVQESHPAIIDMDMREAVQLEMERRRVFAEKYNISRLDYAIRLQEELFVDAVVVPLEGKFGTPLMKGLGELFGDAIGSTKLREIRAAIVCILMIRFYIRLL